MTMTNRNTVPSRMARHGNAEAWRKQRILRCACLRVTASLRRRVQLDVTAVRSVRLSHARIACVALLLLTAAALSAQPLRRTQPQRHRVSAPLPSHPGNVFLEGEEVSVPAITGASGWRAVGIDESVIAKGSIPPKTATVALGKLSIGWYRVEFCKIDDSLIGWTTAAVLARLARPVPQDSPVCVDSATAWFARRYQEQAKHQEILANLAALAGVNWIRDRMTWAELEPASGKLQPQTRYDTSADLQNKHALNVLQVFHSTPEWAIDQTLDGKAARQCFPRDLRHVYTFCRAMAQRFRGSVHAWEPWNEANISPFGGHTIEEMCSLQKAAYLGFKAGDPGITVCWNVFAGSGSPLHTQGVLANEVWSYFDTYNIHSYSPPERYLDEFATAREGACGRPIWITECGIRRRTTDKKPWGDLPRQAELEQAQFIARSYASSLFAGVDRHFFFILGNYIEREVQFGLLRHDHTPRPGYVALAAVGRFLAGAKCQGRLSANAYLFQAKPDGQERDVVVAWDWTIPKGMAPEASYDYLGRKIKVHATKRLGKSPVFLVLPTGEGKRHNCTPPPAKSTWRDGAALPVVLQASLPRDGVRLGSQAHRVTPGAQTTIPLFAYNFGSQPLTGSISVQAAPDRWRFEVSDQPVRIEPLQRVPIEASVTIPARGGGLFAGAWIRLRGDFAAGGKPVLAFRLAPDIVKLEPAEAHALPAANQPASWQDNIVRKGKMSRQVLATGGTLFDIRFADSDPWAYPRLPLDAGDVPKNTDDGLALTVQLQEGTGTVRVQFVEESGAAYLADAGVNPDVRTPQRAVILFRDCKWGSHSKPDPDGRLRPSAIRSILVGINGRRHASVKMAVSGLAWVRY